MFHLTLLTMFVSAVNSRQAFRVGGKRQLDAQLPLDELIAHPLLLQLWPACTVKLSLCCARTRSIHTAVACMHCESFTVQNNNPQNP